MDILELNKLECARRQLEVGIQLFFQDGDPVSIHTLTCAAYNVIRDVNSARKGTPMFAKQRYFQLRGKSSLDDFNEPENFFKHADRDADAKLRFYPTFTECLLVDACRTYDELTGERVPEFLVFTLWFISQAPGEFDIPREWESFADDAKELHAKGDRKGFLDRFMTHLSYLRNQGT